MTRKIDATRPLYAVVGAGDLAVEYARKSTADVQARFAKIELEPKALRDQAELRELPVRFLALPASRARRTRIVDGLTALALIVALRRPHLSISNPQCVAKSYPLFWRDLAHWLGANDEGSR